LGAPLFHRSFLSDSTCRYTYVLSFSIAPFLHDPVDAILFLAAVPARSIVICLPCVRSIERHPLLFFDLVFALPRLRQISAFEFTRLLAMFAFTPDIKDAKPFLPCAFEPWDLGFSAWLLRLEYSSVIVLPFESPLMFVPTSSWAMFFFLRYFHDWLHGVFAKPRCFWFPPPLLPSVELWSFSVQSFSFSSLGIAGLSTYRKFHQSGLPPIGLYAPFPILSFPIGSFLSSRLGVAANLI